MTRLETLPSIYHTNGVCHIMTNICDILKFVTNFCDIMNHITNTLCDIKTFVTYHVSWTVKTLHVIPLEWRRRIIQFFFNF